MCTVTFYPLSETKFVLTSNRDELPERGTIPPKIYSKNQLNLLFPKDEVAGGTWIGASTRKRVLTLMNGGFVAHTRKEKYKMSRGIIVLNLLEAVDIHAYLEGFDFEGMEPFTVILLDYEPVTKLYQIVWDEEKLHLLNLPLKPRIWSSSPLYSPEMHALREDWFKEYAEERRKFSADELWAFHHTAGNGDKRVSLKMDRGFLRTKSITRMVISKEKVTSKYHDLQKDLIQEVKMDW